MEISTSYSDSWLTYPMRRTVCSISLHHAPYEVTSSHHSFLLRDLFRRIYKAQLSYMDTNATVSFRFMLMTQTH